MDRRDLIKGMAPGILTGILGAILIFSSTSGQDVSAQTREGLIFEPVVVPTPYVQDNPDLVIPQVPIATATPRPTPTRRPAPSAKPRAQTNPPLRTSHRITGLASWYCRAGWSPCHYAYPPGTMSAAACGSLRKAIGPFWRGRIVSVTSGKRTVTVKLVDFCGSRTKLIDLYWEPMRRLGGTGVLPVTVRW